MRRIVPILLVGILAAEFGLPQESLAGGRRRLRHNRVCQPVCRVAEPCPVPCPPTCPPVPVDVKCDEQCQESVVATASTFVHCPKKELSKVVLGSGTFYQMECDRCERRPATPVMPQKCVGSGSSARQFSSNSTVTEKCDSNTSSCASCTRCVCTNATGTAAYSVCKCLTSLEHSGLLVVPPPGTKPVLDPSVRYVKGFDPRLIRIGLPRTGKIVTAVVYVVQRVAGKEDDYPPAGIPYALGFQVAGNADADGPLVTDAVAQFDRCAYRVPFEGTEYDIVLAASEAVEMP